MDDEAPLAGLGPVALAVASGLLLALASPGFGLSPLAWIAWVPLFRVIDGADTRRSAALGFVTGAVLAAATLSWVAFPLVDSPFGALGATGVTLGAGILYAAPFSLFAAVVAWERARRGRFGIGLPALLWPVFEWLRTIGPAAAPWNLVGDSQPTWSFVAQIAEATGVFGVGATIVAVNASIHVATAEVGREAMPRLAAASTTIALALGLGALLGERARAPEAPVIRVGLVQSGDGGDRDPLGTALELSRRAVAAGAELIVWPESATPLVVEEDADRAAAPLRTSAAFDRVAALAAELERPFVVGVEAIVREPVGRGSIETARNRILLLDHDGRIAGTYDKRILVPLGEIVPSAASVRGVRAIAAGERPIVAGAAPARFALAGVEAAPFVCWETIFPAFVAAASAGADLLIELTNDDALGSRLAAEQHFAMGALRAVENRKPLVRAARSGISAVVAPSGAVLARTGLGEVTELVVDVPLGRPPSIEGRGGGPFVALATLATVALLVYAGRSRRAARAGPD